MLELNNKTKMFFLDREWVKKLMLAGVSMKDSTFCILIGEDGKDYVAPNYGNGVPTYTLSELLFKLNEYPYLKKDGKMYKGGLKFCKDAPFYVWYYDLKSDDNEKITFESPWECPLHSAAALLLTCVKEGIRYVNDVSGKMI